MSDIYRAEGFFLIQFRIRINPLHNERGERINSYIFYAYMPYNALRPYLHSNETRGNIILNAFLNNFTTEYLKPYVIYRRVGNLLPCPSPAETPVPLTLHTEYLPGVYV